MSIRTFGIAIVSVFVGVLAVACSPSLQPVVPSGTAPTTSVAPPSVAPTQPGSTSTPTDGVPRNQDLESLAICGTYQDHRYEACAAYVWNDAHWSLQPYYKYVHSDSLFSPLKDRLALKYRDPALHMIQQRAANWPRGTNTVDGPDIAIVAAQSSLQCNRAVLVTRENWTVRDATGAVLYQENGQIHTIVMLRTPDERFQFGGYVLHQWVVMAIYDGQQNLPLC